MRSGQPSLPATYSAAMMPAAHDARCPYQDSFHIKFTRQSPILKRCVAGGRSTSVSANKSGSGVVEKNDNLRSMRVAASCEKFLHIMPRRFGNDDAHDVNGQTHGAILPRYSPSRPRLPSAPAHTLCRYPRLKPWHLQTLQASLARFAGAHSSTGKPVDSCRFADV